MYGHSDLRADVLHSRVSAGDRGLVVGSYGMEDYAYPYGPWLFVYHAGRHEAYVLHDAAAARTYLASSGRTPPGGCPSGRHGTGSPIFGTTAS
jgi:hypothetical protein